MKAKIFSAGTMGIALLLALSGQTVNGRDTNIPTTADQQFLQEAIKGGVTEVTEARNQLNSSDPNVRTFAQILIRDHTVANGKLAALADKDNIKVDTTPKTSAPMDGKAYMQHEVADHQQDVGLFKGEVQNGTAEDIRTLAKTTLPVLQGHLDMAQEYVRTGKVTPVPTPSPLQDNGPGR